MAFMKLPTLADVMTKPVKTVRVDTPIMEVAKLFHETGYSGFPVVNDQNQLLGIVTQYEMLSTTANLHLPTLQSVLSSMPVFRKDKSEFSSEVEKLTTLTAKDVMNVSPLTLSVHSGMEEAIHMFQEHHRVNPIPVIDADRKVVGVVSRYDFLKPLELK